MVTGKGRAAERRKWALDGLTGRRVECLTAAADGLTGVVSARRAGLVAAAGMAVASARISARIGVRGVARGAVPAGAGMAGAGFGCADLCRSFLKFERKRMFRI